MLTTKMKFGMFLGPFHRIGENPTLALDRDLELLQWLDWLGFDEAWIGEHSSAGWETISAPELFIATAAERTKHIKLGTGVIGLPYHHPLILTNRMILLDHLTKGRMMLGVGPGTLLPDAYMIGSDPLLQRQRMAESLDIIMRLLTESEPITYKSDWFTLNEAFIHLRPYSTPHFPIAVAASQSPSGLILAGKHGTGVLSLANLSDSFASNLNDFWKTAEESAQHHNKKVSRAEWKLTLQVHIAETRKDAINQVRKSAGILQREYFEKTLGFPPTEGPIDEIVDKMIETGQCCIGTPDDLINAINHLDEISGGFGGLLIMETELGNREQVRRSYELIARYVMPQFQGSIRNLEQSVEWSRAKAPDLAKLTKKTIDKANKENLK